MNHGYCLEVSHRVYYSTQEPVPIAEIASSLLALERIIHRLPRVLSAVTSVPIQHMEVYVDEIHSGSLEENILLKLFFANEQELEAFLTKIREGLKKRKVTRNVLIGVIFAALVGYGLYKASQAVGNSQAAQAVNVNNNVIINIGAKESGMTPEQLVKIVEAAVSDKKANAKDAIAFVKPAKSDSTATITIGDQKSLVTLTNDAIQKSPSSLDADAEPTEQQLLDVDLDVRATNLDSQQSGWAGLIPGLIDRRVKLVLADGVDPKDVAGKFKIRADVLVHSKPQGRKKVMTPYQITILQVVKP